MRVRATRLGYYEHVRRFVGDVFILLDESQFSKKWMEKVSEEVETKTSSRAEYKMASVSALSQIQPESILPAGQSVI